ncbi:MAG: CmcJ/NvfI family oxidoreductase [Pseudomonadota bacterium]|nr:CmcJ/NvfI family oxidoreductase [Pseudomonadota bacterium]
MSETALITPSLTFVETELHFIVDDGEKPVMYVDWPEEAHKAHPATYIAHRCRIADGRPMASAFTLPDFGFSFHHEPSQVKNFYDPEEIKNVYDREVANIIKRETGASRVIVFDHTFRTANDAVREANSTRAPVKAAHNDYTETSARQRLRDIVPEDEARRLSEKRFAIVQTWRPINHPVETEPFALCDGRTIPVSGFVPLERRYKFRTAETYHLCYSEGLEWYYFPKMAPEEVLVFKVFDTDKNQGIPFTAHTAFDDPTSPVDARPRESVESRALVFF